MLHCICCAAASPQPPLQLWDLYDILWFCFCCCFLLFVIVFLVCSCWWFAIACCNFAMWFVIIFVMILFMWHLLWYVFLLLQCFWLIFVVVIAGLWFCCQICLATNKCNGYYCRSVLRNEMDISRNEVVIYREPNMAGEQSSHHVAVVQQTSWTFGYRLSVGASYKEDLGVLLLF